MDEKSYLDKSLDDTGEIRQAPLVHLGVLCSGLNNVSEKPLIQPLRLVYSLKPPKPHKPLKSLVLIFILLVRHHHRNHSILKT